MSTINRLKELETKIFTADGYEARRYYAQMQEELYLAWPQLLAVVEAAKDFLASDGDFWSWTEDERHCLSRLKESLLALEE